ncbi:MAG: aminotransferase class I/II-fold pyridoxal phosphate-dependent enzyme [Bacteroidota bacterium]|nr:aminotransferase class I/II-fold pyridoxal phosphate-dependent enzyme [Bacteroidota bacterium]
MSSEGVKYYTDAAKRAMEWHNERKKAIRKQRFDTIAVHGIYSMQEALDFNQGSIIEPIYMSTSQSYRDSDEMEAALSYQVPTWCYSRIANPSMYYLEGTIASLEGYGTDVETSCIATASGMSAIQSAVDPFLTVDRNDPEKPLNFVASTQVYGGTFQQFAVRKEQEKGIEWRKVTRSNDLDDWLTKIDENTRFLYAELPSNPGLAFFDLKAVIDMAHSKGIPVIIDSTVATPVLMRPLALGADIVIHSVSKTMGSSGFGIAGAVISRKNIVSGYLPDEAKADFCSYLKLLPNRDNGPTISPMNAILSLNDIRTIRSKVDVMSQSSLKVARFLQSHKHIEGVEYLGLESHPMHKLASEYMYLVDSEFDEQYGERVNRYGHLMSFLVKGGHQNTRDVFDALQMIWRATDLGRIKSVATIPTISTHQQQGEEGRKLANIPDNLVRLSVGQNIPTILLQISTGPFRFLRESKCMLPLRNIRQPVLPPHD